MGIAVSVALALVLPSSAAYVVTVVIALRGTVPSERPAILNAIRVPQTHLTAWRRGRHSGG